MHSVEPRSLLRGGRSVQSARQTNGPGAVLAPSYSAPHNGVRDVTAETSIGPELIEDVVIRFAGDSGDGMQIAGDRFTDASAIFGNDLATLPNFPAEIRAPAGTIAGVSSFQVHISDHDIVTPGDAAERSRGDEPRCTQSEPRRDAAGVDAARELRRVRRTQPGQGRLRRQPARRRFARGVPRDPGADDEPHARSVQGARREAARCGAFQELLRGRPHLVDVHATRRSHARVDRPEVRLTSDRRRRERGRVQGGAALR